ncbi:AraC family transcriptional regulator [Prosthecobacter dejongeii]|uniref:AraC-like DNA-binding protein n=1 Tax=Prosthecobacter dejongeii TaxID=48465 RepID=A0A7W7YIB4_9BACT|nr:AraC family transcriptional regulator [Prosthecobacter dejongeii]MBB5036721.1 AraC-like DNA-binding protein [Prosthecobacter dejongeii]
MQLYTNPGIIVTTKMMRNATLLKPRTLHQRPQGVVRRWQQERDRWVATLAPTSLFHRLFDHIPGVYFFAKNREGHLMFASEGLRLRYSMHEEGEILGMTDFDLNPGSMAQAYVDDDDQLLTGKATSIERIELWWDRQGMPDWFLVTKLPVLDTQGEIQGVMGLLRRPDEAERRLPVFQTVAQAVEMIRQDFSKPLLIEDVARACGQSLRQLQRRFQTTFGLSPQEFLLKTRVLAAARLLETTALSVSEIACRCGFTDQSAFTQHFRKRTGQTPSSYRNQN